VGVGYLTLDRASRTLSGGEVQRVALTAALGTSLTGTLMVLDEPTAGLHPRDAERAHRRGPRHRALGNVALVIEHDLDVIAAADRVIELGPDAGEGGGTSSTTATRRGSRREDAHRRGAAHAGRSFAPEAPQGVRGDRLAACAARAGTTSRGRPRLPAGVLTVMTGVSGSGKSSLVGETLYPAVTRALAARALPVRAEEALPHDALEGAERSRDVYHVDQGPLGRTTRGNPATYLKLYERIRSALRDGARVEGARVHVAHLLVQRRGRALPHLRGGGLRDRGDAVPRRRELPVPRLPGPTLQATRCSRSACAAPPSPTCWRCRPTRWPSTSATTSPSSTAVGPMRSVGLGYLRVGQSLSHLSGGEAQRLKLAAALGRGAPGSLVILDEPTTGLHRRDVARVFDTLDALVDAGRHRGRGGARPLRRSARRLGHRPRPRGRDGAARSSPRARPRRSRSVTRSRFAPFLRDALDPDAPRRVRARAVIARRSAITVPDAIILDGAREHNLQVPHLEIPREKLVAMTGPSGSGKSSLAFDVIYAEGQRRFLETLSPYARQYLPSLGRADVDASRAFPRPSRWSSAPPAPAR
jgi:excinuclease ABC subunit A